MDLCAKLTVISKGRDIDMKKGIIALIILLASIILLFVLNRNEKNKVIHTEENKVISDVVDTSVNENNNLDSSTNISENTNVSLNTIDDEKDTDIEENIIIKDAKSTNSTEDEKTENAQETKKSEKTAKNSNDKKTIVIDPGHQTRGDPTKEPIGPGATETKAKVTTGATGISTKQKESELALKVALLLEKVLKEEGYNVIMTRTTNNVNISNKERAMIANDANADAFLRIHADSYSDSNVNRNINIMPNC